MPHSSPLVVVATPVEAATRAQLAASLESIQVQTYPHLLHLLAYDASTEPLAHGERVALSVRSPILTAISGEPLDAIRLWNFALQSAPSSATYLRLLRPGDTLLPEAIAKAVAVMEQDASIGLVTHNHFRLPSDGVEAGIDEDAPPTEFFAWPEGLAVLDGSDFATRFFRRRLDFGAAHVLLRTSLRGHRAEFFDPGLPKGRFEGVLAASLATRVALLNEPLGHCAPRVRESAGEASAAYQDFLVALHRHGPSLFQPRAFQALAGRYRRHYLRNTLRWRMRYGAAAAAPHFATLAAHGAPAGALNVANAMLEGALVWAGFSPEWREFPT